ncbi:MAG: hypothetical protein HC884_11005 [Chloroflexaceae bacterium]|nr:hypothetical protein [Chloroflexaceae bacterium]
MALSSQFRNLFIAHTVVAVVIWLSGWWLPGTSSPHHTEPLLAPHQQQTGIVWDPPNESLDIIAGQSNQTVSVKLRNTGSVTETVAVTMDSSNFPEGWSIEVNPVITTLTLAPSGEQNLTIFVSAPDEATTDSYIFRMHAQTSVTQTFLLTVNATEATPTRTPTPKPNSVELISSDTDKDALPGKSVVYKVTIRNPGDTRGSFRIRVPSSIDQSCQNDIPNCYETTSLPSVELDGGQSREFDVSVVLPSDARKDLVGKTTVRAYLEDDPSVWAEIVLSTTVLEASPTPTETNTPTKTPTPLGRICKDIYERDDHLDDARVIDVNVPQPNPNKHDDDDTDDRRVICPPGDEDWVKFAAVGGKVYTIDVTEMAEGIDLSLEIFDEEGRSLAFNDDYFKHGEEWIDWIRPSIDSWRAPTDGVYYVRIRDAAGRGGLDRTYTIEVRTESYGPTPITVDEECLDIFEPDGLPEQASLLISNERQENRSLCPTGDADWVTFFGKANKRYFIYTDTRSEEYGNQDVNNAQSGADTVLMLTDRDGLSMIKSNDDIPGGDTLDSQIEFIPEVDGFYYVQIKNVGDIGNQFIRYDLVLELCKPGQTDCGRVSNPETTASRRPSQPAVPTLPAREYATRVPEYPTAQPVAMAPQPAESSTPDVRAQSTEPDEGDLAYRLAADFADPSFWHEWQRTDLAVANQRLARPWIWGPSVLAIQREPFSEALSGARQVQYFDYGRMEINNPQANPDDPWFVSSGLLALELVTGRIQVGMDEFRPHHPANLVPIGEQDDPSAPTYATFQAVMATPFTDMTGEYALDVLDRSGTVRLYDGPHDPGSHLASFVPETHHNIPLGFWEFFHTQGEIYEQDRYRIGPLMEWQRVIGYPLSEPYWARVRLDGGARWVLMQVFQRRLLAFVPDALPGEQVRMSPIGRHYYQWRYGEPLP